MFKWMHLGRRSSEPDLVPESGETDRDTGEDEYESHEEEAREVAPSDMTRVKTDEI